MVVLTAENIAKNIRGTTLFENATIALNEGEKVGIVGRNGTGKSTFLKCLAGAITPDEGSISMKVGASISMLEQSVSYSDGATLRDFLYEKETKATETLKRYQDALEKGDEREYTALLAEIEKDDLWGLERRFESSLTEMGESISLDAKMDEISGGQQKKAAIARTLAAQPDIILLDEPTNHLDIKSIEYLEAWIDSTKSSMIIVTHDRHMLTECCTTIWELDKGTFYRHPGSFAAYLERKAERLRMEQKRNERAENILRRELEWLKRGPKARTGKDKGRKDRIDALIESIERPDAKMSQFQSEERRLGKKILEVESISKSYDGHLLFSDFSLSATKGMKLALIGDNGTGKSTLLDILSGHTEPDTGSVDIGANTVFGYYDQLGRDIRSEKTVIEYTEEIGKHITLGDKTVTAARFLELFGFPQSMQRTPVNLLSGGERRRLYLITRLLASPNFLLLDEPTNDLDIETIEMLEEYILSFPGCAIISSHDRTFLDMATEMTLVIENQQITLFPGTYSQWREDKLSRKEPKEPAKEAKVREKREKKGLSYNEKREKEALENEIPELEAYIKALEDSFSTPSSTELGTLRERTEKYNDARTALDQKMERWMELESIAEN